MARDQWHILREGGSLTMARRLPVRFDVAARTVLPGRSRLRMARQVRQDMWRLLRDLRGFSPVVRVRSTASGLAVTAGGRVEGRCARARVEAGIAAMLSDPARRARWSGWAS